MFRTRIFTIAILCSTALTAMSCAKDNKGAVYEG